HDLRPKPRASIFRSVESVHAPENAVLDTFAFGHWRMSIIVIHESDVIKNILLPLIHSVDSVTDDNRELERKCGIVRFQVRRRICQKVTISILMLQSFTGQSRASRSAAQKKSL